MYFLFAYWGGIVRKSKLCNGLAEEDYSNFSECLFGETIEAWVYGPVVPDVYHENNLENFFNVNIFLGKEKLKDFVDGLLKELFEVSDFTLVEISHNDNAWKDNFTYEDFFHDRVIQKEEIISEYARK